MPVVNNINKFIIKFLIFYYVILHIFCDYLSTLRKVLGQHFKQMAPLNTFKYHSNNKMYPQVTNIDSTLEFTYKKKKKINDLTGIKPPKLKRLQFIMNEEKQIAKSISFEGKESNEEPIETFIEYDTNENLSYYDKCLTTLEKIGEGSFGTVFKVRSKKDGQLYAVKVSRLTSRSELYRLNRLEEVRYYEKFSNHENCLRLYEAWEERNCLYMQMELCRENLEQYLIRKRYIQEIEIWTILYDILMALKCLHDRNLIHLDIKLNNILIAQNGICKLGDFGIVTNIDRMGKVQITDGDSRYMAPEVLDGNYTKSADIFSLGIAIFELASYLELPGNGPLWHQLRQGQLPEKYLNGFSDELCGLIKIMMSPDPSKRPEIHQLLQHHMLRKVAWRRRYIKSIYKLKECIYNMRRTVPDMLTNGITIMAHYLISLLVHLKLFNIKPSSHLNITYDNDITNIGTITTSHNNDALCFVTSTPLNSSDNCDYNHSLITSIHSRSYIFEQDELIHDQEGDDEDDVEDDDTFTGDVLNSTMLYSNDGIWNESNYNAFIPPYKYQKTPTGRMIHEQCELHLIPRRLDFCSPPNAKKLFFASDDSDYDLNS